VGSVDKPAFAGVSVSAERGRSLLPGCGFQVIVDRRRMNYRAPVRQHSRASHRVPCRAMKLPQCAGFLSLCAGAGRARSKAHPSSNGFGCAAIFNALTVPPQAGFRICAKSLLGIDPANCRVASSDRLALAHGSLALRVSANLSDHSLSTAILALLTRSCPSRRLRRTAEMGGKLPSSGCLLVHSEFERSGLPDQRR
jgi:hypothetical protein